jgi:hypothetical protein
VILAATFSALSLLAPAKPATLVAAGDIASCRSTGDSATAALVATIPGTVAVLGDAVYERGTATEFARCYGPTWGRFRARTKPALGNHEYYTAGAAGALSYWRIPRRGYYSYELGAWHVVVLNSNCAPAGGCGRGSPQQRWLEADLAAHPTRCTLAYWHHPRWSSGFHGSDVTMNDLWNTLARAGADVVLAGHDHDYERFAPIAGIRSFVVGTGGRSHYPILARLAGSEIVDWRTFGVLRLTLRAESFDWRFVPVAGATFTDAGSARCR